LNNTKGNEKRWEDRDGEKYEEQKEKNDDKM
jgi:hypothetical protein